MYNASTCSIVICVTQNIPSCSFNTYQKVLSFVLNQIFAFTLTMFSTKGSTGGLRFKKALQNEEEKLEPSDFLKFYSCMNKLQVHPPKGG